MTKRLGKQPGTPRKDGITQLNSLLLHLLGDAHGREETRISGRFPNPQLCTDLFQHSHTRTIPGHSSLPASLTQRCSSTVDQSIYLFSFGYTAAEASHAESLLSWVNFLIAAAMMDVSLAVFQLNLKVK